MKNFFKYNTMLIEMTPPPVQQSNQPVKPGQPQPNQPVKPGQPQQVVDQCVKLRPGSTAQCSDPKKPGAFIPGLCNDKKVCIPTQGK